MVFEKETNLYQDAALINKFRSQDTQFDVVLGKISYLISDSDISQYQDGKGTITSRMNSVENTSEAHTQTITSLETSVNSLNALDLGTFKANTNQWIQTANGTFSTVTSTLSVRARTWTTQPTPPYNVGDLWIKDNELYNCVLAKNTGQAFNQSDWTKSTKYTDDSTFNNWETQTYQSFISQLPSQINLQVTGSATTTAGQKFTAKASIIADINADTSGVSISADKINLSGYVTISALSTAGSTTINGSNITTGYINANRISGGTIDASKITVSNLNASNITSGTLSANRISGGTINGNTVSVINLSASNITSGTLSANRISGGTINGNLVSVTNINASNINSGTLNASRISGGILQANDSGTYFDLNNSNIHFKGYSSNNPEVVIDSGKIMFYADVGRYRRSGTISVDGGDDIYLKLSAGEIDFSASYVKVENGVMQILYNARMESGNTTAGIHSGFPVTCDTGKHVHFYYNGTSLYFKGGTETDWKKLTIST